jgi:hypothetical protein
VARGLREGEEHSVSRGVAVAGREGVACSAQGGKGNQLNGPQRLGWPGELGQKGRMIGPVWGKNKRGNILKCAGKKDWARKGFWATLDGKGFWAAEISSNFIQGF